MTPILGAETSYHGTEHRYLRNGKDVRFNQPPADSGFAEWNRQSLRGIAAGARIPYELLTGDLTQVNFSSSRVGLNEYRTMVDALRWHLVIPLLCEPIWRWFVEAAFAAGLVPTPIVRAQWDPPSFPSVNPKQDVEAAILRIRGGLSTLYREIGATGYSPAETLDEIASTNARLDELGIVLDTDPRRTSGHGGTTVDTSIAEQEPLVASPSEAA